MNEDFEKNALSWGDPGAEWLKRLPAVIKEYEQKWKIQAKEPFPLNYNYVAPAVRNDGSQAVLKIGFPEDREFKTEIEALELFGGDGVCNLLEVDKAGSAMLIERITPGRPLSEVNDDEATRVLCAVMKRIHKPLPTTHTLLTLEGRTQPISAYKAKYKKGDGPLPLPLVSKAETLLKDLLATSAEPMLLHGDLHHDNVLFSDEHGWTAIDPKGIAAEPAYEVAPLIGDPYETLKNINDLKPLLNRRLDIFAEELGFSKQRLVDWCFAHCMLSAIWNLDGTKGPEHMLRVAQALN